MGTVSFGEGDSGREGWPIPYEDAVRFFRQALDLAITLWDTANGYNAGTSEEAVGPGAQGAHPPRRDRRGDQGVLPGPRRSARVRSVP
jgi:aryl-alcohol dehydrogenase-like predicted oxidoreductase